jgi:pimeloyl-ACP methyl ester carboxylesterase
LPATINSTLAHEVIAVNGVRLHVVTAGEGPLVLLLHGFPEFWYGWRHQIDPLVRAGYRVVIPDQRGYNASDKPRELADYARQVLARDVVGLLDHFRADRATVVGHDWGGMIAWWAALQHAERVERLVALNIPHPAVFARALRGGRQALRSWYILLFQLPWLPELLLSARDHAVLVGLLRRNSRPGAFTSDELERYRQAFRQPGAVTAMLAWYRAAVRIPPERLRRRIVEAPTLVIWGRDDPALGWEMAAPSAGRCREGRAEIVEGAGHFVAADAPDRVNQLLLAFLGS